MSRIERGHLSEVGLPALRRITTALDARLDLVLRWQGGDLDRLLNRRHSAMHEAVARLFGATAGWAFQPEVSFAIYGERGVIDVLAWQATHRALLVVELKTEIVDVNDLLAGVDRKRRLAPRIALERGWTADTVSAWLVVAESATNRRRFAAHSTVLRTAFPQDGRSIRYWLESPTTSIAAASFLSDGRHAAVGSSRATVKRVRVASKDARAVNGRRDERECVDPHARRVDPSVTSRAKDRLAPI